MATDLEHSVEEDTKTPQNGKTQRKQKVKILFPITLNENTYYWTTSASKSYIKAYDILHFDDICIGHVMENIQKAEEINGKIVCPEIILSKRKDRIMSVKINISDYQAPDFQEDFEDY